jgi:hypothetical protein
MKRSDAVRALDIYKRASNQVNFYHFYFDDPVTKLLIGLFFFALLHIMHILDRA